MVGRDRIKRESNAWKNWVVGVGEKKVRGRNVVNISSLDIVGVYNLEFILAWEEETMDSTPIQKKVPND